MKKLVIVCEEKHRQFGDFLAQLISLKDDEGDQVIGVKDGSVAAQVWEEKEYISNALQISSEQYIIFIGNSKLLKGKRRHMQSEFSKHGMYYGWLGKQGALFVDNVVSYDDYDEFINYAQTLQPEMSMLIEKKIGESAENEADTSKADGLNRKLILKNNLKAIQTAAVDASAKGMSMLAKAAMNKKILQQQYSCLVLAFYFNGLSKFLGMNEA